jgi:hypothetical protein
MRDDINHRAFQGAALPGHYLHSHSHSLQRKRDSRRDSRITDRDDAAFRGYIARKDAAVFRQHAGHMVSKMWVHHRFWPLYRERASREFLHD